jgi:nicotinamidase-related amidase
MQVFYVKVALRPGHPELSEKSYPIHAGGRDVGAWTEGTWGAEIVDELKPRDQDIVITNYSPNVFLYTNLDQILRAKKIENLFLTGTATNFVVEEAARYAAQIGYDVTTVEDCCTSFSDEMHEFSVKNILPQFGAISQSGDIIEALG